MALRPISRRRRRRRFCCRRLCPLVHSFAAQSDRHSTRASVSEPLCTLCTLGSMQMVQVRCSIWLRALSPQNQRHNHCPTSGVNQWRQNLHLYRELAAELIALNCSIHSSASLTRTSPLRWPATILFVFWQIGFSLSPFFLSLSLFDDGTAVQWYYRCLMLLRMVQGEFGGGGGGSLRERIGCG